MRTVSDDTIKHQTAQPDIPYIGDHQLMDVAHDFNYTYDDYVALATECKRYVYSELQYKLQCQSIEEQRKAYMAEAVTDFEQKLDNSILGAHWA